ncbi:Dipeptide transport ATP-binding protein DppD [Geodia barretti]|uniref:Dipeptide transport ATP-binding protein DppD n=1 Tax=Geodia barretti TaxID=519541 RepID=A0AA35TXZ7_GEOBA|nr:Dipeptide transport ATP-binding protein DppD [Geodia barretti]
MASNDLENEVVLEVEDLRTYFSTRWGTVKAVDGVSFDLRRGETLGIVGESGCGKSVTMLSLMRLVPTPPGEIVSGKIVLQGQDILQLTEHEMSRVRGSQIALIIQDPMTSLNPVFSIGNQVNIPAAESRVKDYPHQLSGGMRQRVVGAIGISCEPAVLIADEPTTSLDVTIQAQYLKLLKDLQQQQNLALIFITHDFGVVAKMCDKVAVMYAGKIVEMGDVREIFNTPSHPYTEALLASVPKLEEDVDRLYAIEGQPPALHDLPPGCSFADRCPYVMDRCRDEYPPAFQTTGYLKAVDGISFQIQRGETLGIVGESGCGKSTTAKLLLMLEEPTEGRILFEGEDIHHTDSSHRPAYRSS